MKRWMCCVPMIMVYLAASLVQTQAASARIKSPDGKWVASYSLKSGSSKVQTASLKVTNVVTNKTVIVTTKMMVLPKPVWRPDSKAIAYATAADPIQVNLVDPGDLEKREGIYWVQESDQGSSRISGILWLDNERIMILISSGGRAKTATIRHHWQPTGNRASDIAWFKGWKAQKIPGKDSYVKTVFVDNWAHVAVVWPIVGGIEDWLFEKKAGRWVQIAAFHEGWSDEEHRHFPQIPYSKWRELFYTEY